MKRQSFAFLFLTILAATGIDRVAALETRELKILPGEHWWAGVISESDRMPLKADSNFEFDFTGNTAGNQGQPLLISNRGRFVWCNDPFWFDFTNGSISLRSAFSRFFVGTNGATLASAHQLASQTFFSHDHEIPDSLLFARPQFNTWIELAYNQNQSDIMQYARCAVKSGYPPGVLMIDEGWAKRYGNWDFDRSRFDNPEAMITQLHQLGFKVMLWVCPYISPDGQYFKTLWQNQAQNICTPWILDATKLSRPAIMEWWDGFSAVVDLTNPQSLRWFKQQLDFLIHKYGVDGFKFDGGDAEYFDRKSFLTPIRTFDTNASPDEQSELYGKLGLNYPLNEYRSCWKLGGQALAQRLRDKAHTWTDLAKLIPQSITQGLMGYPFTCPDMIGGGEYLSFMKLGRVDQELIVRAAQCQALMPMMQFSVAPWRVLNVQNQETCLCMAKLHAQMSDEILALAREAARTKKPIIRSLEYEYPGMGYADITDQFLLGRNILVAPVQTKGATKRIIQFPPGTWKGDDGSVVKGPQMLEVYSPLRRLPWYYKITKSGS